MNMKEVREMTDAELSNKLEELYREKLNLKIQSRTGQLEKIARPAQLRKEIARIKTEQTCRQASA